MKNKILTPIFFLLFTLSILAGDMRDAAALTGAYVNSSSVDVTYYQTVSVEVVVSGVGEALTCALVPQWSTDNLTWISEPYNVVGTASATEQPITRLDKRFNFSVSATGLAWGETFTKWGAYKYFRVKVKESTGAGTTTALVQIKGTTNKTVP